MILPLKNVPKSNYSSFEETWGGKSVDVLDIALLQDFPEHKFKLYTGARRAEMLASVEEFGVLTPLIVWKREDGSHVILSGHNRKEAAKSLGLKEVPVVVKEGLSMEEAILIVTESNLRQRSFSDLSLSEQAFSLAQHYEASKSQGRRNDLLTAVGDLLDSLEEGGTCVHPEHRSQEKGKKSRDILAEAYGISPTTMVRYLKIATLDGSLLELLDGGTLPFLSAYELSFVTDSAMQKKIAAFVAEVGGLKQSLAKALRGEFEESATVTLEQISGQESEKQKEKQNFSALQQILKSRLHLGEQEEMEKILEEALWLYDEKYPGVLKMG